MKKIILAFLFILLIPSICLAVPNNSMSISPVAVDGRVITADDENSRNEEVANKYNPHTHTDIESTSATTFVVTGNIVVTGWVELHNKIQVTTTVDLGWTVQSFTNRACTYTCGNACVFGFEDTGDTIVNCSDATADKCLCAGSD